MTGFILRAVIAAFGLWLATEWVDGVVIEDAATLLLLALLLGIVNALWAWNELLIAVVMLQSEESRTLQAGLALLKGKNTMDIPLVMAGAVISAVPLLLLYLFGQRVFLSGMLAGAIKE